MKLDLYKIQQECEKAEDCLRCRYSASGECLPREFIGNHLPRYWNLDLLEISIKQEARNKN